ncbi:hypothetical protein [Parabacteroides merdae]|jgi:hypothetical protein|uniref:Virulence protein n=1 Tax=Parabacteroides merdae TaxID=46503 RepID=A0A7K1HDV8_9BACT|nr:hypothetical protein [Parabacteroides merdae]MTU29384.1 hypothetical protein [Parabacteroides merdae]RYS84834.1 hypothetical protein EAJ15_07180 [Parabacteroides merdae]UVS08560.1 hypothetical protein NXY26_00595 [Parabacteroides distasonis]
MNRGIITISESGAVIIPTAPVWMTQFEIADLFGVFSCDVRKAIRAIYKNKELNEADTMRYVRQPDGISYDAYSLEMVIAVAFRICSRASVLFRRFVMSKMNLTKKETPVTLFVSCGRGNNLWYS